VLSDLDPEPHLMRSYRFGRQLGLAFQVVDDILDFTRQRSKKLEEQLEATWRSGGACSEPPG
jgi:geranylgeranyl pyrophosphate synthase